MTLLNNIGAYYKFDENTGSSVNDATGGGTTGTWSGTLGSQWITGLINSGGNFNGTDNFIDITSTSNIVFAGSFTLSAWVYLTAYNASNNATVFIKFNNNAAQFNYYLDLTQNTGIPFVGFYDGTTYPESPHSGTGVALNTWTHVAGVFNTTTQSLTSYINGLQNTQNASVSTTPVVNAPTNLRIGNQATASSCVAGRIDEVGLWNRALTNSEIGMLYNRGLGFQYPFFDARVYSSGMSQQPLITQEVTIC